MRFSSCFSDGGHLECDGLGIAEPEDGASSIFEDSDFRQFYVVRSSVRPGPRLSYTPSLRLRTTYTSEKRQQHGDDPADFQHQLSTFLEQYLQSEARKVPKSENALRLGILSTAAINKAAVIYPARTHGGVIVSAIASRELNTAQEAAKRFDIPQAYGSYEELLNEPGIDAVYISVPNGMHGEMARKALNAGKHVLLEKPFTANADEARSIVKLAAEKHLVLVEAFHWQYHDTTRLTGSSSRSPPHTG
uniref:D-xylose 1-dehydrogenase (NADP(+), D-xylono-1,5-lactone-forming) n=1 Tax=Ganoderma boninense TaxID=34458 RepID=A0A5K1JXA6_9APHY|nr:Myo-inositol-2-dehydrogenase [Ganoderma boninense]